MDTVKYKILLVEDEAAIREMLEFALGREGFEVMQAPDAHTAQMLIGDTMPDVVLLDWMLPGISGLEYAQRLRRDKLTEQIPIIMLTARDDEQDKIRGLELAADDYITKPFSTQELVARIRALLRRSGTATSGEVLTASGLSLDRASHRVAADGKMVELGPTEFRLLEFFMSHSERVYSRNQLLDQVWGNDVYIEERTVDVHIRRLRKALEPVGCEEFIQTVRGAGYRFSLQH